MNDNCPCIDLLLISLKYAGFGKVPFNINEEIALNKFFECKDKEL